MIIDENYEFESTSLENYVTHIASLDDEYHDALYKHKKKKKRKDRDNDVRIKTEPPEVKQEPLSPPHHARKLVVWMLIKVQLPL